MSNLTFITVFAAILALSAGLTQVRWCNKDRTAPNGEVKIAKCREPPCNVERGTMAPVSILFTPMVDVKTLTNDAKAITRSRGPIPILGIDGTDACKNVYTLDEKPHGCPLRKGQTYLYKNEFEVLHNNPKFSWPLHWVLRSGPVEVVCFEVPAINALTKN